jgi:hypothetical protein
MKTLTTLMMLLGIGLFTVSGCSPEDQLQQAQEDFAEERQERAETSGAPQADGMLTPEDRENIAEEQAQDIQSAGEVIQQEGELIEDRIDD